MKLSTKGKYGVIAMLDLAVHSSGETVTIKSIAERQNISESYLEQLFAVLRKSGLIKSSRGSQGGYMLAEKPGEITVGAILRAMEGSLAPVSCIAEDNPSECGRADDCVTKHVWKSIRDSIYRVVDSITLEELVEEYNSLNENAQNMFYI